MTSYHGPDGEAIWLLGDIVSPMIGDRRTKTSKGGNRDLGGALTGPRRALSNLMDGVVRWSR